MDCIEQCEFQFSVVVINLLKGVIICGEDKLWNDVCNYQHDLRKYLAVMGLTLKLDEVEKFAWVQSIDLDESELPKLSPSRNLNYMTSLLLALLRKELARFDDNGGIDIPILSEEEIIELVKVYFPLESNEYSLDKS